MSEWITDRLPTEADSDMMGKVWIFEDNAVYWSDYSVVTPGTPWMPIKEPATYVKPEPKRWKPDYRQPYYCIGGYANVYGDIYEDRRFDIAKYNFGNCFKTRAQAIEAARRVRELLLNYHKELNNDQMES